ncbi:MAG: DUF4124 domain-containing protein [Xanthomonadaceae bacterium]|jgi:hypothetical protein|nr:DUF4124 domain-containing protein [Xanthomonadaceae bacterium]
MRPLAIATAFALLALSATAPAVAQQYYKWKDANGVTHYTKTPPPAGTEAERLAVQAAPATPAAAPATEAPAQGDGMTAEASQKRGAACEAARNNLTTLQQNPFVTIDKDGDGTGELLTPEEHNAQLAIAREQVRTLCPAAPAPGG